MLSFPFPPCRRPNVHLLNEGSICLVFVKEARGFRGEFKVLDVRRVSGK